MASTAFISGDPSLATSWTNGLPDANTDAHFTASSAACTLTGALVCNKLSFANYRSAFTSNGYPITMGSFESGAGAISNYSFIITGSTIINKGNIDFRFFYVSPTVNASTVWIQRGGTLESPNLFYTKTPLSIPFRFEAGSVTQLMNNFQNNNVSWQLHGTLIISSGCTFTSFGASSDVYFGETAVVTGQSLAFNGCRSISGNFENVNVITLYFNNKTTFASPVRFGCNATIQTTVSGAATCSSPYPITGLKSISFYSNAMNSTLTVSVPEINWLLHGTIQPIYGSINYNVPDNYFSGTNDQRITVSGTDSIFYLTVNKGAGNLVLLGNGIFQMNDSYIGGRLESQMYRPGKLIANNIIAGSLWATVNYADLTINSLTTTGSIYVNNEYQGDKWTINTVTVTGIYEQFINLSKCVNVPVVIFDKINGYTNVTVSYSGVETDLKLKTKGTSRGKVYFSGVGTVQLVDKLNTASLNHDPTIIIDENGFGPEGQSVILGIAAIPVDKDGIPIFKSASSSAIGLFSPCMATDVQIDNDKLKISTSGTNKDVVSYSSQLPVTKSKVIAAVQVDGDSTIKAYRNSGCVAYPLTSDCRMTVIVASGDTSVSKYVNYCMLAWAVNENGIPIIKVVS